MRGADAESPWYANETKTTTTFTNARPAAIAAHKRSDYRNAMLKLPITPIAKPRMTRSDRWRTDPNDPNPDRRERPIVTTYRGYAGNLRILTSHARFDLPDQLRLTFLLPMPPSWSKHKRTEMEGRPHQQTPDLDNLIKGFTDALTDDDAGVWNIAACKLWAEEGSIVIESYEGSNG